MKCLKRKKIQALIDNEMSPKERRKIEEHLSECATCEHKLNSVQKKIDFVKKGLESLNPITIPQIVAVDRIQQKGEKRLKSPIRKFMFSTVKVPALVLVVLGVINLTLFGIIFSKIVTSGKFDASQKMGLKEDALYLHVQDNIHVVPVDFDLSTFSPIKKPNIIVLSQEEQ
jgi:anti-sigma factor RsiW